MKNHMTYPMAALHKKKIWHDQHGIVSTIILHTPAMLLTSIRGQGLERKTLVGRTRIWEKIM
jgi:hypothetical protein